MNNPTPPRNYSFDWDEGNLSKIEKVKASGRQYDFDELESVFDDPYRMRQDTAPDLRTGETSYRMVGVSNQNRVISVIFVVREGKIRIFNVMKTERNRLRRYYERKETLESEGPIRP